MSQHEPYNPLDKLNLGASVAEAILRQTPLPLPPSSFSGAGIYVIYYTGNFAPYGPIANANRGGRYQWPIYIGKAIPKGGRKGRVSLSGSTIGPVLSSRLQEHAESIRQTQNLRIEDFSCRYLVVDDIWIPLGETLLIRRFLPVWNLYLDGFGNHDPGSGRYNQKLSPWDVVHPGRPWAMRCLDNSKSLEQLLENLAAVTAAGPPVHQ